MGYAYFNAIFKMIPRKSPADTMFLSPILPVVYRSSYVIDVLGIKMPFCNQEEKRIRIITKNGTGKYLLFKSA